MANTLTLTAQRSNSTLGVSFLHPATQQWVAGVAQGNNYYQAVLTGVPAGQYGAGTSNPLICRLEGSNPTITGTYGQAVTVQGNATKLATPTQPQQTARAETTATFTTGAVANATGYKWQLNAGTLFTSTDPAITFTGLSASTVPSATVQALYGPDASRNSDYSTAGVGTAYSAGGYAAQDYFSQDYNQSA